MKISQSQGKLIEDYFRQIPEYRKQLRFREWELLENKSTDENIGGGKSNRVSDPTARKALLLAQDSKYQHLEKVINAVEQTYETSEPELQKIVEMRYWDKEDVWEWEDIADQLYMSRSKVLKKRDILIRKTAERLGWV